MKTVRKSSGFTLIEMIITMGIMAVAISAIVTVFNVTIKTNAVQMKKAENQMTVRSVESFIRDEIRNADLVEFSYRGVIPSQIVPILTVTNYTADDESVGNKTEYYLPKNQTTLQYSHKSTLNQTYWSPKNEPLFDNIGVFNVYSEEQDTVRIDIGSVVDSSFKGAYVEETVIMYVPDITPQPLP